MLCSQNYNRKFFTWFYFPKILWYNIYGARQFSDITVQTKKVREIKSSHSEHNSKIVLIFFSSFLGLKKL